nr:hypothetical protein [Tanacetum cinerariifolium]
AAVATQVAAASTPVPAAKPKTLKIATALAASTRRRKGVVIRDPEKELHIDPPAETPTDDDVFVEAIPLAHKVPVVDYQVVVIDNKPRYKIIRADDTH